MHMCVSVLYTIHSKHTNYPKDRIAYYVCYLFYSIAQLVESYQKWTSTC